MSSHGPATGAIGRSEAQHEVVVIGAGLTGLAAAARLDELGIRDYLLVEREDSPGGWAKTDRSNGFAVDRAMHVLYFRDEEIRARVEGLVKGRWTRQVKRCVIDSEGVRTPFPYHANLFGRPDDVVHECMSGLLGVAAHRSLQRPPANFLEWIVRSYGQGVARHFMVPYNTKMWTVPPERMAPDWMGRFVPPVDVDRAVEGATRRVDSTVGLNAEFFYPEAGISTLANALAASLRGSVRYGTTVIKVDPRRRLVHLSDGSVHGFGTVISTMPLPGLAVITDGLSPGAQRSVRALESMDLVLVDIGVRSPRDDGEHWAYLPDPDVLGYRLHAVHNLNQRMVPKGYGLYTVEIAHSIHRPLPREPVDHRVVDDLLRLGWVRARTDVAFLRQRRFACAYALPLLGTAAGVAAVRDELAALGVRSVGRYGEWKYSNMEDALVDGRAAVDHAEHRLEVTSST